MSVAKVDSAVERPCSGKGDDAMAVGDIAQGAGITRGALLRRSPARGKFRKASATCEHIWLLGAGLTT
ncbi:hypothetical protein ACFZBU_35505 [Embleya sp. NPDC008237]|uniref:hypothetical protein n=1 Tax=Embleya sp. NPDC008237 TaxID=3363978 RepID=UPI0036E02726